MFEKVERARAPVTVTKFDVSVIVHEMGQGCVYPNFDEMSQYVGPLKPQNFGVFRDSLAEHGMLQQAKDFFMASGKLQVLCYKEEIGVALRTPGIGGGQLLDLHDFPGQGTALVGVLIRDGLGPMKNNRRLNIGMQAALDGTMQRGFLDQFPICWR